MYALEQRSYDAAQARDYLIDNYATINTAITNTVNAQTGAVPVTGDWLEASKGKATPCSYLATMYTDFAFRLSCLRASFNDISGGVYSAIGMKRESGSMQGIIPAACANETPASSPACARLAGLDYSTYYGEGAPPVISDLQSLNYALAMREQEMQQAISTLLKLMATIGCDIPASTGAKQTCPGTGNEVIVDMRILGGNTDATKFTIQKSIGYNSVESLKISLQEISPYFSGPAYDQITQQVLGTLSGLLRLPSPERYNGYADTMKAATTTLGTIKKLVPVLI